MLQEGIDAQYTGELSIPPGQRSSCTSQGHVR